MGFGDRRGESGARASLGQPSREGAAGEHNVVRSPLERRAARTNMPVDARRAARRGDFTSESRDKRRHDGCSLPAMGYVLVVDDDHATVEAMASLLRQDGHEVEPVTSGHSAVTALRRGRAFDVVVTDLDMPSVDGAAVAKAAREASPNACIVVTDHGVRDPLALRREGACVLLDKPVDYETMCRIIAGCQAHGGHGGFYCERGCPQEMAKLVRGHPRP